MGIEPFSTSAFGAIAPTTVTEVELCGNSDNEIKKITLLNSGSNEAVRIFGNTANNCQSSKTIVLGGGKIQGMAYVKTACKTLAAPA